MSRIYIGNLPIDITEREIEDLFYKYGRIIQISVKNPSRPPAFAFVEFEDARDAEDAVYGRDGYDFDGERIRVEISHGGGGSFRGPPGGPGRDFECYKCGRPGHFARDCRSDSRDRYDDYRTPRGYSRDRYDDRRGGYDDHRGGGRGGGGGGGNRNANPDMLSGRRYSDFRVLVGNLPPSASWQDLKDHMRKAGEPVRADVDGRGNGLIEYSTLDDMEYALRKLDDSEFRNPFDTVYIRVKEDPDNAYPGGPGDRGGGGGRSRSR
eukprot:CAMPEP_0206396452 /NCGR_PEP_ID=MMETSP0294-20121207/22796_1 /ASSEMBLY_ACC=CAM_ASM_000327 /TAXON_ID=39354 /ORGANISM="Heterosigma akashiwo, Strain CCMP2393" /LENGTH=264 /DNA_ID=CAMNT_0053851191 /DNA_START=5 /DNA_END=796 /DNA_ORIENTATION=+